MKKTDMTNEEIKLLIEVAVDSAFCAVFESSDVKMSDQEKHCKDLAVRSLTLLAKSVNQNIQNKTVH